ncbi:cilia- and flagella-associated protein 100-like [Gambusia affinis]|uniref:cilia- and flagella-associated protein 100-like n=1 Tax=Gambusia affinis TaxID=33528 RepID=UPI000F32F1C8|nr:cilia- and flagella-associated protein 100-like [Gambusia affinis]XP_043996617.1 cilia- and flagella-associated protein 100-like [Gambusia affinis]
MDPGLNALPVKDPTLEIYLGKERKYSVLNIPPIEFWTALPNSLTGRNEFTNYKERKAELRAELVNLKKKANDLEKLIRPLETEVKCNQHFCERELNHMRQFIARIERKPIDAKNLFENAIKSKQESSFTVVKCLEDVMIAKSEFERVEHILNRHKCYANILFNLAPQEWQEAKEAEILKAKEARKEPSTKPEETADSKSVEAAPTSSSDTTLPSESTSQTDTESTDSAVPNGSDDDDERIVEIYFTDPFEVVVLPSELTDQILSLIDNATEMDKILEQTLETTRLKMEEDEKKLTQQESNLESRIEMEKKRAVVLRKQVQLHNSLETKDEDILLEALGKKVTEVYLCCFESRIINQGTLEKLCCVEHRMNLLLQQIEKIPRDMFETLWEIKDGERRTRAHEEKLREEREKQKLKMSKCMRRASGVTRKVPGRKIMQRWSPVQKKAQVTDEPSPLEEIDPLAELYTDCD